MIPYFPSSLPKLSIKYKLQYSNDDDSTDSTTLCYHCPCCHHERKFKPCVYRFHVCVDAAGHHPAASLCEWREHIHTRTSTKWYMLMPWQCATEQVSRIVYACGRDSTNIYLQTSVWSAKSSFGSWLYCSIYLLYKVTVYTLPATHRRTLSSRSIIHPRVRILMLRDVTAEHCSHLSPSREIVTRHIRVRCSARQWTSDYNL